MRFLEKAADFLFSPCCPGCGEINEDEGDLLCAECRPALERAFSPQAFLCRGGNGYADEMFCLFPYKNPRVQHILFDLKECDYESDLKVYLEFAMRAAKKMPFLPKIDVVTFSPRSVWRRRKFYIDQSEVMAKRFAEAASIPFETLLKRRGLSLPQHRLRAKQRERNVKDKYCACRPLAGESVLLIDDVVTTGSSVIEAARALKAAGAMHVFVFCFAH